MKNRDNDDGLGKFISLILRHDPKIINITLDENGWGNVDELIKGINKKGMHIDFNTLERMVYENNKQRYSFNDDKTKIRANQGHSIKVDIELDEKIPPEYLYHGTATRFIDSIMESGVQKQSRQFVHLSTDLNTAYSVGKRHGKPIALKINAKVMFEDGYKFYLSKNAVWLTEFVPSKYISVVGGSNV